MGRQVPIFATQVDVNDLTAFLRETTEVAIFVAFAETAERLWVETPAIDEDSFFYVWNKHFLGLPPMGECEKVRLTPDTSAGIISPMEATRRLSNLTAVPRAREDGGGYTGQSTSRPQMDWTMTWTLSPNCTIRFSDGSGSGARSAPARSGGPTISRTLGSKLRHPSPHKKRTSGGFAA